MGLVDRLTFRAVVPRSARKADHVLAVSERTKRDAVELYGLAPDRITVTPLAVDPAFAPGDGTHDGYLLFVGAVQRAEGPARRTRRRAGDRRSRWWWSVRRRIGARRRAAPPRCRRARRRAEGGARGAVPSRGRGAAAVPLRRLWHSGARGDGERCARRALGRSRAPRGRGRRGRVRAVAEALADRDRYRAAGLARAAQFSWRRTAELTVAAYRKVLAA